VLRDLLLDRGNSETGFGGEGIAPFDRPQGGSEILIGNADLSRLKLEHEEILSDRRDIFFLLIG